MTQNRFPARRMARSLLVAGLIAAVLGASPARAQVTLNFVDADIDQVAKAIGAATNKTIIVDPRVKGQLNLVSEQPVPREQALKTLQSALRMQGFALVQDHGVLKVVPEADAKLQGVPTYIGNTTPARGDQVVTQVFQLRNESANNLLPVLRPLISPNNQVAAYPSNNTLVVTDYADNVRRIGQIIQGIDTSAGAQVQIVPLKNASAVDVAQQLGKLLDPGAIGGTDATLRVSVNADPRTNSVLLRAASPSRLAAAKSLIATLDAPTTQPGNIHVVPLRNAEAVRMAKTLRGMLGGSRGATGSESQSSGGKSDSFGGGLGSSTGTSGLPPLPSGSSSAMSRNPLSGSGGAGGFGSGQSRDQSFSDKESSNDDNAQGGIVQADPATNSLIITAPEPLYRNIRNVIDQLDQRRAQVYIEAVIVDMNATSGANLGIQWQGALLSNNGNNGVYGGSNFNANGSQSIVGLSATGAIVAQDPATAAAQIGPNNLLNNGLNIGLLHRFGKVFGLGGLLQALATSSDTNILSTPNLITLDNEEARIVVGQNVPVVTGSYATPTANTTTSVSAFNTFDRQDVGITLHIKPQISEGGVLKLQIYQEDSAVQQGTQSNPGGVSITKRSIQSTVLADDGEIIVLGGLIQDNYANGNSKVPWLGNIPVLGSLFRSESKTRTKSNLMVFLRPVIVRDQSTSSQLALDRYEYLRAEQAAYQSDNRIVKDRETPLLPPAPLGPNEGGGPAANNVFDLRSAYGRSGPHHGNGADARGNGAAAPSVSPPVDAPDASVGNADAPVGAPGASVGNADAFVGAPDASVSNADALVGAPNASVSHAPAPVGASPAPASPADSTVAPGQHP
ncbi:type II secretion system secretin GspD [Mycetohabitans rhizoxinica]|uniref:type II secretion system secretin GspD n=1 Tax=Mycetohabitans rhizoxinica TaxID=412963 RepID=UPI0030D0F323